MQRDMELIRTLILKLESWPMELGSAMSFTADDPAIAVEGYDTAQIYHHLKLIHEIGLFDDGDGSGPLLGFVFCGLTWKGHDFIDTIRSPEIWRRTKAGAKEVGSWSVELLLGLAKGYAKQIAKEKLGFDL